MSDLVMPRNLVETARQEGRTGWLTLLPTLIADLTRRWSLEVDTPFQPGGQTAWVAPARDRDGHVLVLKII